MLLIRNATVNSSNGEKYVYVTVK